jgi:phenylacetate-CoA ligase
MIWNREAETRGRAEVAALQLERVRHAIGYAYDNVPFYKKKFDAIGLKPSHVKTLKDVALVPLTCKDDLRDNYPYGMFAVPMEKVVRLHASSGTTGKPIVVGYTKGDLENWSECIARLVCMAGGGSGDIAQISFGYGLFTGGFGLHYGLEKVGATVVPVSSGNSEMQLMLMKDFGSTLFVSTPSYILYLSEYAQENGVDMSGVKLRTGMFGGEGHTEEMRREIERRWGIHATENYGLTEVMGPGVSGDCLEFSGLHINEDHFYPEIIDSDTGEPLPEGEQGELVLTTLTKEAIPMLRYRTKDITYLDPSPCKCGRTSARMHKVLGRTDDMLIIRGVNVFPSQIESVLMGIPHIGPHYQIVVTKKGFMDAIEVQVELADASLLEEYRGLERLERAVHDKIKSVLRVESAVKLVEPHTLARFTGKAKRVVDLRGDAAGIGSGNAPPPAGKRDGGGKA